MDKRKQDVRGGEKGELPVRHSGGNNKEVQGSRMVDRGQEDPADEEIAAAAEARRRHREAQRKAKAAEKEMLREEREIEEAERDLDIVIEDVMRMANEGFSDGREEKVEQGKKRSQNDDDGVDSQRQSMNTQHSQVRRGSQAEGSAQGSKATSQRQEHQERLERLASQKRSQEIEHFSQKSATNAKPDSEDSETESESDVPVNPPAKTRYRSNTEAESENLMPLAISALLSLGKKRVSQTLKDIFPCLPLMYSLACSFSRLNYGTGVRGSPAKISTFIGKKASESKIFFHIFL